MFYCLILQDKDNERYDAHQQQRGFSGRGFIPHFTGDQHEPAFSGIILFHLNHSTRIGLQTPVFDNPCLDGSSTHAHVMARLPLFEDRRMISSQSSQQILPTGATPLDRKTNVYHLLFPRSLFGVIVSRLSSSLGQLDLSARPISKAHHRSFPDPTLFTQIPQV